MPPSIFIETTIPSYYVSRPSRDVLQFARQELTREWWDRQRQRFRLCTSQFVLDEAGEGEPAKAAERLELLAGIELLAPNEQAETLTVLIVDAGILPVTAIRDASHLAVAGVHRVDFLLTWNYRHIANPFIAERLRTCFSAFGVQLPVICTPEQFILGDDDDAQQSTTQEH